MTSECPGRSGQEVEARWGFFLVFTLLAIGIASIFVFVAGRSFAHSEIVLTQIRVTSDKLKRAEQLIETLPGGVAYIDVQTGTFLDCNEGFRRITGLASSDIIGKSVLTVVPEEFKEDHRLRLLINREKTWDTYGVESFALKEVPILRADGTTVHHYIRITGDRIDGNREWQVFIDPR